MFPAPENSSLEIRMTKKGVLRAFWKGEYLPAIAITLDGGGRDRAEATLRFMGSSVRLTTEIEDEAS